MGLNSRDFQRFAFFTKTERMYYKNYTLRSKNINKNVTIATKMFICIPKSIHASSKNKLLLR